MDKQILDLRKEYAEKYGFKVQDKPIHRTEPGLSENVIREMSEIKGEKGEHEWVHKFRLRALNHFMKRPMPKWGGDLSSINFGDITYYIKPTEKQEESWEELPPEIKNTFDKLGIPEAERKFLAGVGVQFDSENVYHSLKKDLEKKGVIFVGPDEGLQKYPHVFKKWFGSTVPPEDNKFAALNSAFFSGGSFIYIPPGVEVKQPLQAYFRINAEGFGQFERTLIIIDKGAKAHYIEGCTAPIYSKESLHAAVVEVIALHGSHFRYTTLQNWSNNVYNLVTKRAHAFEGATVEWLDANIGCLTGDAKVFTNNDLKVISEVKEGDVVYSLNQNFEITKQSVIGKKVNEPTDVFKLTTNNYREVEATANHPFLVLEKIGTFNYIRWKRLDEIKTGDMIACLGNLPDNSFTTPIYFSKVIKIEYFGKEVTYDIEIDGTSNFIANGIFAHNSKLTMKYPSVFLRGPRAKADILSVAFAGKGQHQDTGGKVVHLAPNTTSKLIAKSVSKDGGRTTYRGLLHVSKLADNVKSTVRCDALLLDEISKTDTYPYNEVNNESATITHEATVGKIGEQQLFYLMSRGLNEQEALSMIVSGFFDAFAKEIPLEYAVEFNRLIQLEMTGAVG